MAALPGDVSPLRCLWVRDYGRVGTRGKSLYEPRNHSSWSNSIMSVRLSLAWTYLAQVLGFLITFGSTVVVARLVSPRDFGIFAMATAATTIINLFMQFGLAKYIMREEELSRELLQSLFTVNVLLSLTYVGSILVGAVLAGSLFGSDDVGRFLYVFALFPLFAMFEFIPEALCSRNMRFGVISLLQVARAVVMAGTTMFMAWKGYAFLSFAWAQVLAWATTSIFFNVIVWRPDVWRLRFAGLKDILKFGSQMIGISGLSQFGTRAGEMILGSLLGLANLGLYSRAASLPATLYGNIFGAGGNVIFSRMSLDLRETGEFHQTYLRFMRLLLGLMWPMLLGLAVLSRPVIHILYGAKWEAAAVPLSLLTLTAAVAGGLGMAQEIFILRHETARQMKIELVRTVLGLVLFLGGALISLPFAAAAKLFEALLAFALYRRPMNELIGGPAGALRGIYFEAAALAMATALPSFVLMLWTGFSPETPLVPMIISVTIGGLSWVVLLWRRRHPLFVELFRLHDRK